MGLGIRAFSRRGILKFLGSATGGLAVAVWPARTLFAGQESPSLKPIDSFTGPEANPHWNSVGPYVSEPQKAPLLLLTDRPVQLETPRHYFRVGVYAQRGVLRSMAPGRAFRMRLI